MAAATKSTRLRQRGLSVISAAQQNQQGRSEEAGAQTSGGGVKEPSGNPRFCFILLPEAVFLASYHETTSQKLKLYAYICNYIHIFY